MPTALYGVIGWPVGHSASPAMMNAAFADMGIDAYYGAFPVQPQQLATAIAGIRALGLRGVNVTIPHKQAVLPFVHTLTEAAQLAGAVNTLRFDTETGNIDGHNTDIEGWWFSIKDAIRPNQRRVVVLGGGGAARAILVALSLYAPDLQVSLVTRRAEQAAEFQAAFATRISLSGVAWDQRHEAVADADVVINTTPIGMWPNPGASPLADATCLHSGQVVQDIVYRPLQTLLLQQAVDAGAQALDGLWMLVYQGAAALQFWLREAAPPDSMRIAALAFLQNAAGESTTRTSVK